MELSKTRNEIRGEGGGGASGEIFATKDDREAENRSGEPLHARSDVIRWKREAGERLAFPGLSLSQRKSRNGISAFSVVVSLFYKPRREQRRRGEQTARATESNDGSRKHSTKGRTYPIRARGSSRSCEFFRKVRKPETREGFKKIAPFADYFTISREFPTTNAITVSRNQNFNGGIFAVYFSAAAERERERVRRGGSF